MEDSRLRLWESLPNQDLAEAGSAKSTPRYSAAASRLSPSSVPGTPVLPQNASRTFLVYIFSRLYSYSLFLDYVNPLKKANRPHRSLHAKIQKTDKT